jgi:hypothetical protein
MNLQTELVYIPILFLAYIKICTQSYSRTPKEYDKFYLNYNLRYHTACKGLPHLIDLFDWARIISTRS